MSQEKMSLDCKNNIVLHKNFGLRSTGLDIVKGLGVDISNKVVIVTGGASGIGYETTLALAHGGAHVIVAVRDMERTNKQIQLIKTATNNQKVEALHLELDSFAKVKTFVEEFKKKNLPLHILINNAGVMATPHQLTIDGFESQFGTNHLGHFLLTNLLTPILAKSRPSRVVCVASTGHKIFGMNWDDINWTKNYNKWTAYGQSKTANVLFAKEYNRHHQVKSGITAFALDPGAIMTGLQKNVTEEEKKAFGWYNESGQLHELFKTPAQGCSTSVYAALAPELEAYGGAYLENCTIAVVSTEKFSGVAGYAADEKNAAKLWELSEKLVKQQFPAPQ